MNAAYPAAWAAHALLELGYHPLNMFISGLLLLDCHSPADPLIAR